MVKKLVRVLECKIFGLKVFSFGEFEVTDEYEKVNVSVPPVTGSQAAFSPKIFPSVVFPAAENVDRGAEKF